MGYEAFITVGSMLAFISMLGYKWGITERVATDFLNQSMGG